MPISERKLILEEFQEDISIIGHFVSSPSFSAGSTRVRVAAANSAVLLLSATFEEFIREIASSKAKDIALTALSLENLPKLFLTIAWKKTLESTSKIKFDDKENLKNIEDTILPVESQFLDFFNYLRGDFNKEITTGMIKNQGNMRPKEINAIFKICGYDDICKIISSEDTIKEHFGESDDGKVHGYVVKKMNEFIDVRNAITHSLKRANSPSPLQISQYIDFLSVFSKSVCVTVSVD